MFFKKEKFYVDLPILIAVITYAYFISWYSGNIGVVEMPFSKSLQVDTLDELKIIELLLKEENNE